MPWIGLDKAYIEMVAHRHAELACRGTIFCDGFVRVSRAPRRYVVLRPRSDGEVELIYCYARFTTRCVDSQIDVQCVGLASSDSYKIFYRNVDFRTMQGWCLVSWKSPNCGDAEWSIDTNSRGRFEMTATLVNPEGVRGSRYEFADIGTYCSNPSIYLRFLHRYPTAELLHKSGLDYLMCSSILAGGRKMVQFICTHKEELVGSRRYSPKDVIYAVRHHTDLKTASLYNSAEIDTRGVPIPEGWSRVSLAKYMRRAGIAKWEYQRHVMNCRELGWSSSLWCPAASRFHEVAEETEAKLARHRLYCEKKARKLKQGLVASAAELLRSWLPAKLPGGLIAVVPTSQSELVDEGRAMKNCIGSGLYYDRIAAGESLCLFLRSCDGARIADIEFRLTNDRWDIAQCYARGNLEAPQVAWRAANAIVRVIRKNKGAV